MASQKTAPEWESVEVARLRQRISDLQTDIAEADERIGELTSSNAELATRYQRLYDRTQGVLSLASEGAMAVTRLNLVNETLQGCQQIFHDFFSLHPTVIFDGPWVDQLRSFSEQMRRRAVGSEPPSLEELVEGDDDGEYIEIEVDLEDEARVAEADDPKAGDLTIEEVEDGGRATFHGIAPLLPISEPPVSRPLPVPAMRPPLDTYDVEARGLPPDFGDRPTPRIERPSEEAVPLTRRIGSGPPPAATQILRPGQGRADQRGTPGRGVAVPDRDSLIPHEPPTQGAPPAPKPNQTGAYPAVIFPDQREK